MIQLLCRRGAWLCPRMGGYVYPGKVLENPLPARPSHLAVRKLGQRILGVGAGEATGVFGREQVAFVNEEECVQYLTITLTTLNKGPRYVSRGEEQKLPGTVGCGIPGPLPSCTYPCDLGIPSG